jgi:hypothetical protein
MYKILCITSGQYMRSFSGTDLVYISYDDAMESIKNDINWVTKRGGTWNDYNKDISYEVTLEEFEIEEINEKL